MKGFVVVKDVDRKKRLLSRMAGLGEINKLLNEHF